MRNGEQSGAKYVVHVLRQHLVEPISDCCQRQQCSEVISRLAATILPIADGCFKNTKCSFSALGI